MQLLLPKGSSQEKWDGWDMWYMWGVGHVVLVGGGEVHAGFWWGNVRERDHLEDLG
jgi:hypothetical protein